MSIWDDITKGVSDAASFTAKKTGELTNLAKLKYTLHTEESKLSECFEKIGKLYYESQREGTDNISEIAALISDADIIKENIKDTNESIAKLQNTSVCPSCGNKTDPAMQFCPSCGTKLEKCDECDCDTCNDADSENKE